MYFGLLTTFNDYEEVAPANVEAGVNTSQMNALGETYMTSVDEPSLSAAEENGR